MRKHKFKQFATFAAKAHGIINAELKTAVVYAAPGALDHRAADVHSDPGFDQRQQVNQHLPRRASEIENARMPPQRATCLSQISNSRIEFHRPRRGGTSFSSHDAAAASNWRHSSSWLITTGAVITGLDNLPRR